MMQVTSNLNRSRCCLQVLGGADLFLQGLITPEGGLGHFSAEDLRCVSIPQNACPFAVGTMRAGVKPALGTDLSPKPQSWSG